jgi:Protein of unknown function (DUF1573)
VHVFHFRNMGKEPLIITRASASCGCTVVNAPLIPILTNKEDSITAFFNSALSGKGMQNKVITVISNAASSPDLLTIIGNVK